MKKLLASLAVAGLLVSSTAVFAADEPLVNTSIYASFYDDLPSDGGELVEDDFFNDPIIVKLSPSNIGEKIENIDDASYIALSLRNSQLLFEIAGGDNTNDLTFVDVNNGDDLNLSDVVSGITNALTGSTDLAIFTDSDGVVTGFYTFTGDAAPIIDVTEADFLTLSTNGDLVTFKTVDPGSRPLLSVNVYSDDGTLEPLHTLALVQ